jgi:hypothetical protein
LTKAESIVTLVFALPSAQATGTQAAATASAPKVARFIDLPAIDTSPLCLLTVRSHIPTQPVSGRLEQLG